MNVRFVYAGFVFKMAQVPNACMVTPTLALDSALDLIIQAFELSQGQHQFTLSYGFMEYTIVHRVDVCDAELRHPLELGFTGHSG